MLKLKLIAKYLILFLVFTGFSSINPIKPSQAEDTRKAKGQFSCEKHNGDWTTIVTHPTRGKIPFITWELEIFGDSYTPEVRCILVSERFQRTSGNGSLRYIVSGTRNNYPVLCASKEVRNEPIDCPEEILLMTLRPQDDSQQVIKTLADLNTDSSADALKHSADVLQESPNGELVGIYVDVMLRYSKN